jgi:hypothetical protein
VTATVKTSVALQGAWNGTSMNTGLNGIDSTMVLIPRLQPYNDPLKWNYAGTENVYGEQFFVQHPTIVDWVLVELRTGNPLTPPMTVAETRAAFLKSDGSVVEIDGASPVAFHVPAGSYYVVVRHRNHLAIMSAATTPITITSGLYDFRAASTQAYGVTPMAQLAVGVFGLIAGDANGSTTIDSDDFIDTDNNMWNTGYLLYDTNMSGTIDSDDFIAPDNNMWQFSKIP